MEEGSFEIKFPFLLSVFVTCLIIANVIAVKIVRVWGLILSGGIIAYPITFLCTDVICEVWGKERARIVVWMGFGANLIMLFLVNVMRLLPAASFWVENNVHFDFIFGPVWRIVLGSMVAYLLSQHHDVWMFHLIRGRTGKKGLWVRNNVSTILSQTIDTVVFVLIAFSWAMSFGTLGVMIGSQILFKYVIAVVDTPFCYLVVYWVRRGGGEEIGVVRH